MAAPPAELVDRARRFLFHDLWRVEVEDRSLATLPIRLLQFGYMVVEGFIRDELLLRASALTYIVSLSLIPLLVVVLSLLSALGMTSGLVEAAIDYLAIPGARETVLPYVQGVDLSGFGTLGAAILFVTTVLALRHGEHAVNEIWGVVAGRSWTRRFTDYLAILIVAPVLLTVALSLGPTLRSDPVVAWLLRFPAFEYAYALGLRYAPVVLLTLAFTFVYWFLPNTQVRVASAALGGVVASALFLIAQALYVDFNVGAATYSAFFGAAATVPLLLVWIYVSASVFLLGAEISFAHQNLATYRREVQGERPAPAEREVLGLCIALEVARAFRDREGYCTADDLADRLGVPVRPVREVMAALEREEILAPCTPDGREPGHQLGRPSEDVRVAEVLAALRGTPRLPNAAPAVGDTARVVEGVVGDLERAVAPVARETTLATLLGALEPRAPLAGREGVGA
ncbi:MAG: YhjD/YihY/BrkB family envelope integrity protein [Myxococcota bacterium]